MKAFKGLNKDLTCRGFQYKEGETFETDRAKLCDSGFHACERPLDCFNYYAPNTAVYHEVELDGMTDEKEGDTKRCGTRIKIGARLSVADICRLTFDYVKEHCTNENNADAGKPATAGYSGAATAGNYGAATAGDSGAATAGNSGAATAGDGGAATAGNCGAATAGDSGAATAGDSGAATAGYSGAATAGNYGAATAGDSGAATAGNSGAATAGDGGAATAGNCGAATAGYKGAATAGDSGAATSRGSAAVGASGIACAKAYHPRAKGGLDAVLVLAKEDYSGKVIDHASAVVDGEKVKADVWYTIENGQLIECE